MVHSKKANNKGADQTARMRRLVCACVVRKLPKDRFSRVEAQFYAEVSQVITFKLSLKLVYVLANSVGRYEMLQIMWHFIFVLAVCQSTHFGITGIFFI